MFRAVLRQQWNIARLGILLLLATSFALPVASLRNAADVSGPWAAWDLVRAASEWSLAYPLVAVVGALLAAVAVWRPDHRAGHVYALTLPLPRWQYVLQRYAAGLLVLLASAIALGIGAVAAVRSIRLPVGLQAYPLALALQFCTAGLVAYTLLFALSGLTARVARWLVAALLLVVIVSAASDLLGFSWNPLRWVMDAVLSRYSPFAVFRASWMLVDA